MKTWTPSLAATTLLLLLTGCSPRVITDIVKVYPPTVSADSVTVYEPGEAVPNSAESIGRVAVVDAGMSSKCRYDQVLRIAQEETAKVGGNGLLITDHKKPSLWGSSCHQITGTMLLISDPTIDPQAPNPLAEAILKNRNAREERAKKRQAPTHTISFSYGYGYVYSQIETPNKTYKGKSGADWKLEYNWVHRTGFGFGLQYSGFRTDFPIEGYMALTYIAPSFIGRIKVGDAWILKYGIGMGYFRYNDSGYETLSGLGVDVSVGAEYMVSKNVGLGIDLQSISGNLPEQSEILLDANKRSGIARINIQGGVKFYF